MLSHLHYGDGQTSGRLMGDRGVEENSLPRRVGQDVSVIARSSRTARKITLVVNTDWHLPSQLDDVVDNEIRRSIERVVGVSGTAVYTAVASPLVGAVRTTETELDTDRASREHVMRVR